MVVEHSCKVMEFLHGQEPLPSLAPVAANAGAGIAAFRAVAVEFGLAHDDGEDRRGPIGRDGRRAKGGEPALHVLPVDIGDVPSPEPRKGGVAQIVPVDLHGAGLPVPPIAREDLFGHGLEEPVFRERRRLVAADGGQQFRCVPVGLLQADTADVSDGLSYAGPHAGRG